METQKSKNRSSQRGTVKMGKIKNAFKKMTLTIPIFVLSLLSTAAIAQTNTSEVKPENDLYEFYRNYIEAANSRDFKTIISMINDEVLLNGKKSKKEESIAGFKNVVSVFPDHKWQIEDLLVDGNVIAVRLKNSGTPIKSSPFGTNSNGLTVEYTEFASYKIRDGKFVEMWWLIDDLDIRKQLMKQNK